MSTPHRLALVPLLLVAAACGSEPTGRRPSAILVSVDTLRADHLGLYGYERDTTPGLDRLAEESLVFERAFAPASWTLISHMTMLTGLHPNQHGVVAGRRALAEGIPTLAERLQRAGYQTVGLYFEGWIHPRHGFERGFDVFRAHANADEAGAHVEEELSRLDPRRPFFLFLHLFDVHCGTLEGAPGPVYDCPPPYDELFLPGAAERLPEIPEIRLWKEPGLLDEHALEGLVALYDGGIRYTDERLSGWIADWKADGWLEDTLLVITADHGESLGQRGLGIGDHGGPYQEGLRVPLLVRPPDGRGAGERVLATVSLADVAPTVLAFAGLPAASDLAGLPGLPGRSLLEAPAARRAAYALSPESYEVLIRWPEKLVRLPNHDRLLRVDLAADPGEAEALPLTEEEFRAARAEFLEESGGEEGFPPAIHVEWGDVEELERLRELGYGGEVEDAR